MTRRLRTTTFNTREKVVQNVPPHKFRNILQKCLFKREVQLRKLGGSKCIFTVTQLQQQWEHMKYDALGELALKLNVYI